MMSTDKPSQPKRIAVCLFVRDAASDIQEWIAYHRLLGIGTFLIYDNGSRDETVAHAQSMCKVAEIRLHDWSEHAGARAQLEAYDDCLSRYKTDFEFILFLDSDEFLSHPSNDNVAGLLDSQVLGDALALNWSCFGSNGWTARPPGLVIDSFTRRGPDHFGPNAHTKMIVRPALVLRCENPHFFHVPGDITDADGHRLEWHQPGITKSVSSSGWRINHYFVRSWEQWREKLARGYRDTSRNEALFHEYDRNEIEDISAGRRAAEVRTILVNALPTHSRTSSP